MSYYTTNRRLLFRKSVVFEQNISLTEIEEMLPYERTAYLILISQAINEHNTEMSKNN